MQTTQVILEYSANIMYRLQSDSWQNAKDESYVTHSVLISVSHHISLPLMHKWEDMVESFHSTLSRLNLEYLEEWAHFHIGASTKMGTILQMTFSKDFV